MAKNTTPPKTVSDNLRGMVSNKLSAAAKASPLSTVIQELRGLTPDVRNQRAFGAALAMYKAKKNPSAYTPTEQHYKDFAALRQMYAEDNQIKEGKNGQFSEKQLDGPLSPLNIAHYYAEERFKEAGDDRQKREEQRLAIEKSIKEIYPDETNAEGKSHPTCPNEIKELSSFKTDTDFLSLSEDEQKEYLNLVSEGEKDRLSKLAENKNSNQHEEQLKNAGRLGPNMDDPDWGHKEDDDDFKIEQGDIIEYLMKDVILAGAAWGLNKTAGFVGSVTYEVGSEFNKNILRPASRKLGTLWNNLWKASPPNSPIRKAVDIIETNLDACNKGIEIYSKEPGKETLHFEKIMRQLAKHYVVFDDDKNRIFSPTKDGNDTLPTTKEDFQKGSFYSYDTYTTKKTDGTVVKGKDNLKNLQKIFDDVVMRRMNKELNPDNDPAKQKDIEDNYKIYVNLVERSVKTDTPNNAEITKFKNNNPDFMTAYGKGVEEVMLNIAVNRQMRLLAYQTEKFKDLYYQYRFLEEKQKNPENQIFSDDQAQKDFFDKTMAEGQILFMKAEQNRRDDSTKTPSREKLIDIVEKQANDMLKAVDKKSNQPVKNEVAEIITPPTTEEEKSNFLNAKDPTAYDFLADEQKNCATREAELTTQQNENKTKRKNIEQLKEKIKQNEKRGQYIDSLQKSKTESVLRKITISSAMGNTK